MEIERKYRVAHLPENLEQYPHSDMEQAYLCASPTIRIRKEWGHFVLTVKERKAKSNDGNGAVAPIVNREEEFELSAEAYKRLSAKCEGMTVEKCRYRVPLPDSSLCAELDIFKGRLQGLVMVEVEFGSEPEADAFVPPEWFGNEVTADPRYRNSYLSTAYWDGNAPAPLTESNFI